MSKMINAIELIERLQAGDNDTQIGEHFKCHPTVIATLRRTMMSVNPTVNVSVAKAKPVKDEQPPSKDYITFRQIEDCSEGSKNLCAAILRTGKTHRKMEPWEQLDARRYAFGADLIDPVTGI
jgi:hypothetical protein